jgi:CelD/BcsL family acetyltransferase involved in cellulose biosynthesis
MEIDSRLTGRRWVSLPFTDHCVPLYDSAESLVQLIDAIVHLSRDEANPSIELRWAPQSHPAIQCYSHYVLHTIQLNLDAETRSSEIHRMHRRNTRLARERGVRIEWGQAQTDVDRFYHLHLLTRRRQGVPIQPRRFFDLLGRLLIERGLGFVLTAYKDDECLAAAVFLHWQQTLTYKYGASSPQGLNLRPNNLLFWEAIRWGCEKGYAWLDMGRTTLDNFGLRQFKNRWGAEEQPLTYGVLSATSPRSADGKLVSLMQLVLRHSPLWVCRLSGELLYKHFG